MSSGAICVNTLKKDWNPDVSLGHVLIVIRCLLIIPFPESSLNDEAGKLFMDSYDEFARRAKLMADVHGRSHPNKQGEMLPSPSSSKKGMGENEAGIERKLGMNINKAVPHPSNGVMVKRLTSVVRNHNGIVSDAKNYAMKSRTGRISAHEAGKRSKNKSLKRL